MQREAAAIKADEEAAAAEERRAALDLAAKTRARAAAEADACRRSMTHVLELLGSVLVRDHAARLALIANDAVESLAALHDLSGHFSVFVVASVYAAFACDRDAMHALAAEKGRVQMGNLFADATVILRKCLDALVGRAEEEEEEEEDDDEG